MARLAASGRRLLQAMEAEDPVQEAILLWRSGWLRRHAPELARLEGCAQSNPHHVWDAWCHTLAALAHAPRDPTLRLAALYHDVGKPATRRWDAARSRHTFHGHDTEGERIWRRAARRHGFSPQRTRRVARLIRHHLMPARHDDKWGPRALRGEAVP
ncbi:MAG TPA: HD domain-containing protein, partial [Candidatus Thermoplasmatota archaeon]|nr:HD domain-containing protein [Candidatus Thermoplasmatota archaeon]